MQRHGLSVRIVRPTGVYGESDRGFLPVFCELLAHRKFRFCGDGSGPIHLVHVRDLVDAMIACAETDAAHGRAYNIDGPDKITWRAFTERVCRHLNVDVPGGIPIPVAMTVGTLCEALVGLRILKGTPISRAVVRAMDADVRFTCDRAERELGWKPQISLDQGLPAALSSLGPRASA
jgi:nucleoside-diphosphate-sugar epimerase